MIQSLQPPVPPLPTTGEAPVNTQITIQAVASVTPVHEDGGNAANPLSRLPSGTIVEGFVVNRDAQNNPILRTTIGDLKVGSDVFLKTGSEVVFKVDNTQASLARIISVDGLTPENYHSLQAGRGLTRDTVSATGLQSPLAAQANALSAQPGVARTGAPVLHAIILQGLPQTAATSPLLAAHASTQPILAQLAQLRSGTPVRLTLLDLKLPPIPLALSSIPPSSSLDGLLAPRPPAAGATPQPQPHAQPSTSAAQPSPLPPTTAPHESELTPIQAAIGQKQQVQQAVATAHTSQAALASELVSHYLKSAEATPAHVQPHAPASSATPTQATPNAPATAGHAVVVNADVIGHDAEGANILHTPFASLKLYTTQPLPTGTTLTVQAEVDTATPAVETKLPDLPPVLVGRSALSDVLDETLGWLVANHPESAQQLQQRLPHSNDNKLSSAMLFFISAMKGGDVAALLGKRALQQMEFSAPDLLSRLRQEISRAATDAVDAPTTPWTSLLLPMIHGHEIQQLRLYVSKDAPENEAGGTQAKGQRFVFELELSALGAMQLDGFIRQHERGKRFDLMVRSATPLPPELMQGIRERFETSLLATRLIGQVIFQAGAQHFFHPARPSGKGDEMQTILA